MDAMATLRFMAPMKMHGINPYVLISAEQASKLKSNWRKPMPVLVQINGQPKKPWAINMMPVGDGNFRLYLHGEVRKASNTRVGDQVKVKVCFDAAYKSGPSHPMPSWFRAALAKNPSAKKNWESLIPSRKKEILRYFSGLKSPQGRERNLTRALHVLSGKPARFMARSWSGGK
jgi:Bacteriocin-protection, YdeI or OmpD-Associated/Domain of unknown function (DUF1905)